MQTPSVIGQLTVDNINVVSPIFGFAGGASNTSTGGTGGGGSSGQSSFSDFSVVKMVDDLSAAIFQAVASGNHFPEASIVIFGQDGSMPLPPTA